MNSPLTPNYGEKTIKSPRFLADLAGITLLKKQINISIQQRPKNNACLG